MPMTTRDRMLYRADEANQHSLLTDEERRRMLKLSLPDPNETPARGNASIAPRRSRLGVRRFIKNQIHVLIFTIMHGLFSLYIRSRMVWNLVCYQISSVMYYHHATPQYIQKDVMILERRPKHLSAILKLQDNSKAKADLERLIDQTAELATWCACAEIPMLSIYEKTGILKKHMPRVQQAVLQKFAFYFGEHHPSLSLTSPHKEERASSYPQKGAHLRLHLISYQDGRESLVDLTKTLTQMSQRGKLSPHDVSTDLIDAELSEGIMSEPDLLILFGPHVELSGYPPWQVRLSEIFCLPDNETFGYQVFIKALRNYSKAQFRVGA